MEQAELNFVPFILAFDANPDGTWELSLLESPAGETKDTITLPFTYPQFAAWMKQKGMETNKLVPNTVENPIDGNPEDLGKTLYKALFSGEVGNLLEQSMAHCRAKKKGLRLVLRFNNHHNPEQIEISRLPWEMLHDPSSVGYKIMESDFTLVRYLEGEKRPVPVLPAPINVAVVIANPSSENVRSFDSESFRKVLQKSGSNWIRFHFPKEPTLCSLFELLLDTQCQVIHFTGHGGMVGTDWGLVFEDSQGGEHFVKAQKFANMLNRFKEIRLVNLISCDLARIDYQLEYNPFNSVAQSLVAVGVPAVVAMQFPIEADQALTFTGMYMKRIAKGDPIDLAVDIARMSVDLEPGHSALAFANACVFLRDTNPNLFKAPELQKAHLNSVVPKLPRRIATELYQNGFLIADLGDYWIEANGENTRNVKDPANWGLMLEALRDFKLDFRKDAPLLWTGRAWLSLWFAAGYLFRDGFDLRVEQASNNGSLEIWHQNFDHKPANITSELTKSKEPTKTLIVALEVCNLLSKSVGTYISQNPDLQSAHYLKLSLPSGANRKSLEDNEHCVTATQAFVTAIRSTRDALQAETIHLFSSTTQSMGLFLGSHLGVSGKIQLYEWDNGQYIPAFLLE